MRKEAGFGEEELRTEAQFQGWFSLASGESLNPVRLQRSPAFWWVRVALVPAWLLAGSSSGKYGLNTDVVVDSMGWS